MAKKQEQPVRTIWQARLGSDLNGRPTVETISVEVTEAPTCFVATSSRSGWSTKDRYPKLTYGPNVGSPRGWFFSKREALMAVFHNANRNVSDARGSLETWQARVPVIEAALAECDKA